MKMSKKKIQSSAWMYGSQNPSGRTHLWINGMYIGQRVMNFGQALSYYPSMRNTPIFSVVI